MGWDRSIARWKRLIGSVSKGRGSVDSLFHIAGAQQSMLSESCATSWLLLSMLNPLSHKLRERSGSIVSVSDAEEPDMAVLVLWAIVQRQSSTQYLSLSEQALELTGPALSCSARGESLEEESPRPPGQPNERRALDPASYEERETFQKAKNR
jgi:hypothetical protein